MKRCLGAGLLIIGGWTASQLLTPTRAWADPPCGYYGKKPVVMPAPLGTYMMGWAEAQAAAAEADKFVIYRNEWFLDGTTPGPYGGVHLQCIIERLQSVPFPVVIEP